MGRVTGGPGGEGRQGPRKPVPKRAAKSGQPGPRGSPSKGAERLAAEGGAGTTPTSFAYCPGSEIPMSLTGTPFFLTSIALLIVAFVLPLALWSRIAGPRLVRGLARLMMLLFAQVTAIIVVFVAGQQREQPLRHLGRPARHRQPCRGGPGPRPRRHGRPADQATSPSSSRLFRPGRRPGGGHRRADDRPQGDASRASAARSMSGCRRSTTTPPTGTRSSRWSSCCPAIRARRSPGWARWAWGSSSGR